jgi:hypothetical protein
MAFRFGVRQELERMESGIVPEDLWLRPEGSDPVEESQSRHLAARFDSPAACAKMSFDAAESGEMGRQYGGVPGIGERGMVGNPEISHARGTI